MKRILSVFLALVISVSAICITSHATKFSDVTGTYQYATAVEKVTSKGIMYGYGDGTFKPYDSITRAEMAAVICRVKGVHVASKQYASKTVYKDVPKTHWAAGYINYASSVLGVLNGYSDRTFKPDAVITWDETVKIIACLLGIEKQSNQYKGEKWYDQYYTLGVRRGYLLDIRIYKNYKIQRGAVCELLYRTFYNTPAAGTAKLYYDSRVPDYTAVTGCPQSVPGINFGGGYVRYFYNSSEVDVNKYVEYLESIGWKKSGPVIEPGDTRGECTLIGFSNPAGDSYVQIYRFHSNNSVDIITTERFDY